jgi:MFS family permease
MGDVADTALVNGLSEPQVLDPSPRPQRSEWYAFNTFVVVMLGWCFVSFSNTFTLALSGMMEEMKYSATDIGMVVSVYSFGGFFSALWLPLVADRIGRKYGMLLSVGLAAVFNSLIGFTHSVVELLPLRFLSAHGQTCQWGIGASHLSEVVPARNRGTYLGLMQMGTPLGTFLCSATFTVMMSFGFTWRTFSTAGAVALLICIPIALVLKESDQWRANRAARKQMNSTRAIGGGKEISMRELFKRKYLKNTLIAMTLHSIGAFWAWGNMTWFLVCLAKDFHMDAVTRGQMNMLLWGTAIIGYPLAGRVGDLIGRRRAMLVFSLLVMTGVTIMYVASKAASPDVTLLYVATVVLGFGVGVHSILIAYSSEIFPSHVRATGTSVSIGVGRLSAVFSMMALGLIADHFTPTTAELVAAIGCLMMVPIVYVFGVETARKELTDITD